MFNSVKEFFNDHLQRMAARAAAQQHDAEVESYVAGLDAILRSHAAWQRTTIAKLNSVNLELSAANTRAAKNAAWALLAFGLIAIEILAVALYFLPK